MRDDPLSLPLLSYKDAQRILGIGKSLFFQMLADGRLERRRISARRCAVTTASVLPFIEGRAPLPPLKLPNPPRPVPTAPPDNPMLGHNGGPLRDAPPSEPMPPEPQSRLIKRPRGAVR